MRPNVACLRTLVKNKSGAPRYFSFLERHGRTLDAGETLALNYDLHARLSGERSSRRLDAFEAALLAGDLEIVNTPSVYLFDATNDETKIVALDAGTLGVAEPCSEPSSSSA